MRTVIRVNGNKVISFEGKISLTLGEHIEILGIKQRVVSIEVNNETIVVECADLISDFKLTTTSRVGGSLVKTERGAIATKNPFDYYR